MEEFIFLVLMPMLWDRSIHDEVDDVDKPGSVAQDGKKMLVGECITDVSYTWNLETR